MKAETIEKCHILACFLDCSICVLIQLSPSAQTWHLPQWAQPSHVNHQTRTYLTNLPKVQNNAEMFSIDVSSSYINVTFIKLTQTNK